jgi:photosystem II stability/assembly factor-like uncharacterized protein
MVSASGTGTTALQSFAYTTTDSGTRWVRHRILVSGSALLLYGQVLCKSTHVCYATDAPLQQRPSVLLTRNFGNRWSKVAVPWPTSGSPALLGVSCVSVATCVALVRQKSVEHVIWIKSEGSSFSKLKAVPGTLIYQASFSCGGLTVCNLSRDGQGNYEDLETNDGGDTWRVVPVPAAVADGLFDVTCQSAARCVAVGVGSGHSDVFVRFGIT